MSTTTHQLDGPTVGLHFRRYPEVDANIYDNALLVKALGNIGVSSVLIPNIDAYDVPNQIVRAYPLQLDSHGPRPSIEVIKSLQEYPLGAEGINVIRARSGIGEEVEALAAVVNDTQTRELGIDKWGQYLLAGDFMPATRKLEPGEAISSELLDSIPGDKLVIKKSGGGEGHWVTICDKTLAKAQAAIQEMRNRIADKLAEKPNVRQDLIIQEFVPGEIIDGVRPVNDVELRLYDKLGANGQEMRFYSYLQKNQNKEHDYFANLRAFDDDNEGKWIFINQNQLPEGAVLLAQQISDRFIKQVGSKGALVAIDLFRGQRSVDDAPRWLVREINAKDPIMAKANRSFMAASTQRAKLGQLLADLAQKDTKELK